MGWDGMMGEWLTAKDSRLMANSQPQSHR